MVIGSQEKHWIDPKRIRDFVFEELSSRIVVSPSTTIVSGESPGGGPDIWAREWAESKGVKFAAFDPNRSPFVDLGVPGKYHARNQAMVDYTKENDGEAIAFWTGNRVRSGTYSTILKTRRAGVPLVVLTIIKHQLKYLVSEETFFQNEFGGRLFTFLV